MALFRTLYNIKCSQGIHGVGFFPDPKVNLGQSVQAIKE